MDMVVATDNNNTIQNNNSTRRLHTCLQPDRMFLCDCETSASLTLPYFNGLSESIHTVLAPLAIQVTFCPFRTLRQELVHPKDPALANRKKGVVYSIPCAQYLRIYIRQMGRSLDDRLRDHHRALKSDLAASTLAEHMFSCDHQVHLSEATVIDAHTHTQTHCMLESCHIQHQQTPLDRGTLPGLYATLLD